ncbi:formate/nitrite transporter FocA (FNT family) [Sphingobacterium soli]|nr:formate/nitrite transporter FocA (FNT family) [Sphingobacterium soli]
MNKFLIRGLAFTLIGIGCIYYGIILMQAENNWYKLLLTVGVIAFGVGFITLIYRLFRKIDRNTLLDERKNTNKK